MPPFTGGIFLQLIPYIALYGMVKSFYRRFFGLRKTAISGLMFGEKMRIKKILHTLRALPRFYCFVLRKRKWGCSLFPFLFLLLWSIADLIFRFYAFRMRLHP